MFANIQKWLAKRREAAEREAYVRGYDYAAGALLRGDETPAYLESMADTSSTFDEGAEGRAFDRGIRNAVDKVVSLGAVEDNRTY